MFRLVENNRYNSNISVLEEFENLGELLDYLFAGNEFFMYRYEYSEFLEYIQESDEDINVLNTFEFYKIPNASHMADLFKAGKVTAYEVFNDSNGNSKLLVTDDLLVSNINDLLAVYGEVTTPAGVKNVFEIIE